MRISDWSSERVLFRSIAIFLSPLLGRLLSMLVMLASSWALRGATAKTAERSFRTLHLFSSAAYSLSHGLNDAQKTMGIIAVLLYSTGYMNGDFHVPHWVARSEEHTSELQSLMRISYAVFCLKQKTTTKP